MKNKLTNADIFKVMENWAPKNLAYDWDNVGLQVGSFNHPVKKVMVTLDVLEPVVDEAIEKNVDLIIAHHPMLFKPLKQLNVDKAQGRMIRKLMEHNITVYASHTNLDAAEGGVNDLLCDALELRNNQVLVDTYEEKLYKVVVYVPTSHLNEVLNALSENGAGHIGDYSHCTFQTKGTGTFKPLDGTNPFIGTTNELEKVEEVKVETIVQESILQKVIASMVSAHPYEEVAYDIFPLQNQGKKFGIGRIGTLNEPVSLEDFCTFVKEALQMPNLRVTGDLSKKVRKVAVLGGSGEKYIHVAKRKGADVYITGDMTFHLAQNAMEIGLPVIDAGHYKEKIMKKGTKKYLEQKFVNHNIDIVISESNTDPFTFV
ncbi:Nif3-like dinuclear metal center hexameric protein [Ornithinibacillus halophilus]|uniref:GTP cyclohydrolase 1 type 2 homolog n=1 Tax=Ornithinibacillus halophilus TaxID=930117 RepID=A0A1M5DNP8_9BACI|nr:Nif3-like dinuclear metal center hexameric protein [Ornithinibacillus halophilus]SHF68629.1 dinuclear metal center protein, YbgI/SA1388 family [Ornithinibacillus halophilus]